MNNVLSTTPSTQPVTQHDYREGTSELSMTTNRVMSSESG